MCFVIEWIKCWSWEISFFFLSTSMHLSRVFFFSFYLLAFYLSLDVITLICFMSSSLLHYFFWSAKTDSCKYFIPLRDFYISVPHTQLFFCTIWLRHCYKILRHRQKESDSFCIHFQSGVCLGIGAFNLVSTNMYDCLPFTCFPTGQKCFYASLAFTKKYVHKDKLIYLKDYIKKRTYCKFSFLYNI